MSGAGIASLAYAAKVGLFDAATAALAGETVLICYGIPELDNQPDDIMSIGDTSSDQVIATMGTARSREETLTVDLTVSVWREGGQDQEIVAAERAYHLLGLLEFHCRQTDTTLGGVVRQCFLTRHVTFSSSTVSQMPNGRCVEIMATFTANARVTG